MVNVSGLFPLSEATSNVLLARLLSDSPRRCRIAEIFSIDAVERANIIAITTGGIEKEVSNDYSRRNKKGP